MLRRTRREVVASRCRQIRSLTCSSIESLLDVGWTARRSHPRNFSGLTGEDIVDEADDFEILWQVWVRSDDLHVCLDTRLGAGSTTQGSVREGITVNGISSTGRTYSLQLPKSIFSTSAALSPSSPALSFNKDLTCSLLKFLNPQSV